jgi:Holliday junction resolvase RusA-like endonuclease
MVFRLVISGQPVAKGRVRFARKTGHAFTPEKTVAYETKLALAAQEKMNGAAPFTRALAVSVLAEMQIPPSWSRKKQEEARFGMLKPTGRPDADNYAKILDALNLIVWVDDSQIVDLRVRKRYSDQPQLTIEVSALDDFFT